LAAEAGLPTTDYLEAFRILESFWAAHSLATKAQYS
jgi:hypothetical protein